jgi:hypothetical protein
MERKKEYSICFDNGKYLNIGMDEEMVLFNSQVLTAMDLRKLTEDIKGNPKIYFINLNNVNFIKKEEENSDFDFKL